MFFDEWDFNDETKQLCWKLFYLEAAPTMTGSDGRHGFIANYLISGFETVTNRGQRFHPGARPGCLIK